VSVKFQLVPSAKWTFEVSQTSEILNFEKKLYLYTVAFLTMFYVILCLIFISYQARREGEGGVRRESCPRMEFSRAPRHLGAPPSIKNTEHGVPDGFFLT